MKRLVIITGAAGHLGQTLIKALRKEDCHVRGLILPTEQGTDDRQVTYYRGDVTDRDSLEPLFADTECNEVYVIHAAGIISIEDAVSPMLYKVNVEGTKNIIELCLRHRVKRLLYVSSVHAIPEAKQGETICEVSSFAKNEVVGAYAETKAEATQAVLDAVKRGLDAVVVHPSGIIGPYDKGNNHLVQLVRMCVTGKLPAAIDGGYDFVDVRDVAKGCLRALEKGKTGSCYILSNRYCSIPEIVETVRKIAGGAKKLCLPIGLARLFAPFFEWIARVRHTRPLYTRYALYTLSSNSHFSHAKATRELGYHPRDLRKTIADTIRFLRGEEVSLDAK